MCRRIGTSKMAHSSAREFFFTELKETSRSSAVVFRCFSDSADSLRLMEHFRAGDKAAFSGAYKAIHEKDHVPPHYVTAIYGEIFPH